MGMLPFVIAGLAGGAVLLIAIGIAMSGGSGGVASRLERYARSQGLDTTPSASGDRESAVIAGLTRVIERQDLQARLSTEIARADLKLRPAEFVFAWIASPFAFTFVAYVLGFIFPGFHNPVALAVIFAIGAYFPRWYIGYRQRRRLTAFSRQLPAGRLDVAPVDADRLENPMCMPPQDAAGRRQADGPGGSVEDRSADDLLQIGNLLRNG